MEELGQHYCAGNLHTGTHAMRVEAVLAAPDDVGAAGATWDLPALVPALLERVKAYVAPTRPCARLYFDELSIAFVDLAVGPRTWTIGRSRTSDVVLRDLAVSRRHALVSSRGGRCTVRDLGSRNGVWLNGRQVDVAALRPGDVLSIGGTVTAHLR